MSDFDVFRLILMGKPVGLWVGLSYGWGTGCWRDTRGFTRADAYLCLGMFFSSFLFLLLTALFRYSTMMMTAQQTMTTSEGQLTNMGSDGKGQAVTSGDN